MKLTAIYRSWLLRLDIKLTYFQSNAEAELIDRVQARDQEEIDFIIINPAAYTHTSIALSDALAGVRFLSSKFIFPIFLRGNPSAESRISPISRRRNKRSWARKGYETGVAIRPDGLDRFLMLLSTICNEFFPGRLLWI